MGSARGAQGEVAPGFERVREVFEEHFADGLELGASFAVQRGAERLVDLRGGFRDRARSLPWEADTLVNVWSSTKGVVSLLCAMLVDRGQLAYDAPVARYWPEFGARGRASLTVAMLLSHQSGLCAPRAPVAPLDFADGRRVNAMLLEQEPIFPPGSQSGYHPLTWGSLVGELVERVSGRGVAACVRDEIAEPLCVDFHVGVPRGEEDRVAELAPPEVAPDLAALLTHEVQVLTLGNPFVPPEVANEPAWRAAEIPAANGHGNAASLAAIYAALAAGGSLGGVRLLSPETLARATASRIVGPDLVLGQEADWACGFGRNHRGEVFGPNPRTFGHSGYGGSLGCADPDAGIGIGYAMNQMGPNLVGDPRPLRLIEAVYACLGTGGARAA